MPNRLADEQSPYLLQHANNPVDWYPWGDAAFEAARASGKPIFLSIGYATCHWCHVMERESFESHGVAKVLNDHFIAIKVDREERPDVDRVYMTFVQATTGSGGWPMSVWLTPELQPFFGGTYYPPTSQWGRPGFVDVLTEINRAWRDDRLNVVKSAAEIVTRLQQIARGQDDHRVPDAAVLTSTFQQFAQTFDTRRGGFGDAPKFPRPSELLFLLREHARTGETRRARWWCRRCARWRSAACAITLAGLSPLFGRWQLAGAAFREDAVRPGATGAGISRSVAGQRRSFFAQIAEDTLQYVQRDMTDAGGGFYSAEDADSIPPGQEQVPGTHKMEGAFYIWGQDEVRTALGGRQPGVRGPLRRAAQWQRPVRSATGIRQQEPAAHGAVDCRSGPREWQDAGGHCRDSVAGPQGAVEVRNRRPRPQLDDKVLTAWNGLMMAAFARAARVITTANSVGVADDDPASRYLASAVKPPPSSSR